MDREKIMKTIEKLEKVLDELDLSYTYSVTVIDREKGEQAHFGNGKRVTQLEKLGALDWQKEIILNNEGVE